MQSRRNFVQTCAAITGSPLIFRVAGSYGAALDPIPCRIRTITHGLTLSALSNHGAIEGAVTHLQHVKASLVASGYEVQTLRLATQPILARLAQTERDGTLSALQALDRLLTELDVILSIGPALHSRTHQPGFAAWAAELARTTARISFTVVVASPQEGSLEAAALTTAEAMLRIAADTPGGVGNFRFAAAANIPVGTPFFPVAVHDGTPSLALGLESASLVESAVREATSMADATIRLRAALNAQLIPVERAARPLAQAKGLRYLGIDPSPAPGMDRSIGAAIEALTKVPFGSSATLAACASITQALQSLNVRTCGYAGLMLPLLEDPVLAQRANEGRYSVRDLLLYSSVCGTGLDVVPLPGNTPAPVLARLIADVAALSVRWHKPLSARLFPVPGRNPGDVAHFTDPWLTDAKVLAID